MTYFAVFYPVPSERLMVGYVVDVCSEERAAFKFELGSRIIGEFATPADALDAIAAAMTPRRRMH